MPDIQTPVSEYIKQGVLIILVVSISLIGIKGCRTFQKKSKVVVELSSHASESAAYEQFYTETAHENLLKAMYQMHLGSELGLTPNEIIDKVMRNEDGFFESENDSDLPIRKELIIDALLSNFDNCKKLGLFSNASNIRALSQGEMPIITKGPIADEEAVIRPIISNSILAGADKLMPNMIISPPNPQQVTPLERARAKQLLQSLAEANLIERDAYKKVLEHYEQNNISTHQKPSDALEK